MQKLFETLAFFGPLWQLTEWLAWPHKRLHAARMAVVNRGVVGACSASPIQRQTRRD